MTNQYILKIKNGDVLEETGAFFKAGPFQISLDGQTIDCEFSKESSGDVSYKLSSGSTVLARLTHPDYVPELTLGHYCDPSTLTHPMKSVIGALIFLGISNDKAYKAFFSDDGIKSTLTVEITQPSFLS